MTPRPIRMAVAAIVFSLSMPCSSVSAHDRQIEQAARDAYVWGMPLVEAGLVRMRWAQGGGGAGPVALNGFRHRRQLAGPEMRSGVGPNNDTIYSTAWIDLADGPLVLSAPDFGARYYTFSINFADSSSRQSLGQRTHGGQLPPLFLHGPGYRGRVPHGMVDAPIPTRYANIAGRILVRGADDQPTVNALQDRIRLVRWSDWQAGRRSLAGPPSHAPADLQVAGNDEAQVFYRRLALVLRGDTALLGDGTPWYALRRLGLPGADASARFGPALKAGYDAGKSMVAGRSLHLGKQVNGWTENLAGSRFGHDWLLRAGVAKDQIFVAVPEEAIYPVGRVDSAGRQLDGRCRYRIRFKPGQLPPVDAFWSVTAYGDDGFMIDNPQQRYSVGDRTSNLRRAPDGSVTITLSQDDPHAPAENWLPVGAGRFYLMMRLYGPRQSVLGMGWVPPAIEREDGCV